jgi:hypothetical protein
VKSNDSSFDLGDETGSEEPILHSTLLKISSENARYKSLAEEFLSNGEILIGYGTNSLHFSRERRGVAIRISKREGSERYLSSWVALGWRRSANIQRLIFQIALEETKLDLSN